ncbi:brefeldin A-inhibited guanine nucleotide-exchange protein 2-like protein [Tanacetum coccineum]
MDSSEATTDSRLINTVLIPSLEKIINNSSRRKHSKLGVLYGSRSNELSLTESELILSPFVKACNSGELDPNGRDNSKLLRSLIKAVCKCYELNYEGVELLVLKMILSVVTSIQLRIHSDSLLDFVRSCYDVYLGSRNVVNQTTVKASLVQMLVIVFRRMEADSSTVPV